MQICRTDLEGRPTYEAIADYVTATERGTVLERGAWKVSTVEHALSALYAMGVDNCLIEVDGPGKRLTSHKGRREQAPALHSLF